MILSDTIRTTDQNNVHFDSKTQCPGGTLDKCNEICKRHVQPLFLEDCLSRCQYVCQNKLGTGRNNVKPYILGRYDIFNRVLNLWVFILTWYFLLKVYQDSEEWE